MRKGKDDKKSLYIYQIATAVILGSLVGFVFGSKAEILGELGTLLIRLLKTLATPLIFFAIIDAFCKTQIQARSAIRLFCVSGFNAVIAGLIALSLSELFSFGGSLDLAHLIENIKGKVPDSPSQALSMDFMKALSGFVPQSILEPFATNNVISVILIALLVGLGLRHLKKVKENTSDILVLEKFFSAGFKLLSSILGIIVKLVPFAVFGVIANLVGLNGFRFFSLLFSFVAWIVLGFGIYIGIYYSILLFFVVRVSPVLFLTEGAEALVTAFATGSSLVTLPVTLKTLQEKMKVSQESSRLSACMGSHLNHVGILLYEVVAALFIAQVFGIHLSMFQKAVIMASSVFAAIGIAGVPDAGLITLSLVLTTSQLPLALVPALMSVDWFIGRLRATVNVMSDMLVARLLDRFEGH